MKKSDLRELNITELNEKLRECMESLQNYRFQLAMQQLEDFTVISKVRKEIAQVKTVLKEYEIPNKYKIKMLDIVSQYFMSINEGNDSRLQMYNCIIILMLPCFIFFSF